jgi:hypothetical protein
MAFCTINEALFFKKATNAGFLTLKMAVLCPGFFESVGKLQTHLCVDCGVYPNEVRARVWR